MQQSGIIAILLFIENLDIWRIFFPQVFGEYHMNDLGDVLLCKEFCTVAMAPISDTGWARLGMYGLFMWGFSFYMTAFISQRQNKGRSGTSRAF